MATLPSGWAVMLRQGVRHLSTPRPRVPLSALPPRLRAAPSSRSITSSPRRRADKDTSSSPDQSRPSKSKRPSDDSSASSAPASASTPISSDLPEEASSKTAPTDPSTAPTLTSAADFAQSLDADDRLEYDALTPREKHEYQVSAEAFNQHMAQPAVQSRLNAAIAQAAYDVELNEPHADIAPDRYVPGFAGAEEEDEKDYPADQDFEEDDISSLAHGELEQHREIREYARIAAWEMPLLTQLAKPFVLPGKDEPLRFRYTTYLGEKHPAEKKVVLEFCTRDLPGLSELQRQKLVKLVGVRYDPETDIVKMSSEMFDAQAQNKRYLGDLVDTLMNEAKDDSDTFADVPFDFRHHTFKKRHAFPSTWLMTPEREKYLHDKRQGRKYLDERKEAIGELVHGVGAIEEAHAAMALPSAAMDSGRLGRSAGASGAGVKGRRL